MARSIWKGSLQFGLVSIDIELQTAVRKHVLGFKLLHDFCHTPIENKRWCPHCKKEVAWQDTVKGLKLPDGEYFIMTQDNLKKLRPQKLDYVELLQFVPRATVLPVYYDEHYYAVSGKKATKAYSLFLQALQKNDLAAVGRMVMRDKEYICLIQPYQEVLLLSTLNYSYEIQAVPEAASVPKIAPQEMQLAELLMKKLTKKAFNVDQYRDTFAAKLLAQIKKKKGKKEVLLEKPTTAPGASLMKALKESLAAGTAK